ncbi:MAG TPA: hypothetical protein VFE11_17850, partial [Dongiaceae bacterium]|nr:hypothetical protein [Dongiaceae bacterium]
RISPGPSPWVDASRPDISGLEHELRSLTTQIEALRRPCGADDAVRTLRSDLSHIGRTLTEAMPQRAVEALEGEIRRLSERIDHSRRDGVDGSALAGLERGLAEVRDALHKLTPAENLVGFPDAVRALEHKIDMIASTQQDPATLQQLEAAIGALRGIVAHVASNDALAALADEVRGLAAKIERVGNSASPDMLSHLDQRMAHLADTLETRGGDIRAAGPQLEATVRGLIDRVENIQLSRGDQVALGQLEDRIAKLMEKLDASDSRLQHLESIERGVADLLVHLQALRGQGGVRAPGADAGSGGVDGLRHEVEQLKETERRTADSLEVMHGTLGHVVDRLVMIEGDMRGEAPARSGASAVAEILQGMERKPSGLAIPLPDSPPTAGAASQAKPSPAMREHRPIDPSLPPDHPLEPRSAAQRRTNASAADRIAASEAALSTAKPPVIPDPAGKSNFIAAARRAAKAAGADDRAPAAGANGARHKIDQAKASPGFGHKLRSLFVGLSIVIIVLGALRVATNLLAPSDESAKDVSSAANKTSDARSIRPN